MAHVNHFSFGFITPALALIMSVIGSSLGLICTRRSRTALRKKDRMRWLILGATTIGGAGIWLMHFLAMVGFTVDGAEIRYNLWLTGLSAFIAVVVVGFGLYIVCHNEHSFLRLVGAGIFTGLGIAGMHYTGMAAMRLNGEIQYDMRLVGASIVIAIVACTVALWFALIVHGSVATVAAAILMGLAVAGMHYTAMAAVGVKVYSNAAATEAGSQLINILLPVFLGACVMILVPLCVFLGLDTEKTTENSENKEKLLRNGVAHS